MNILMVFPKYDAVSLLAPDMVDRFLKKCNKFVETALAGRHQLFMIAENDTARMLKEDVPKAHYVNLTPEYDKEIVSLCESLSDCAYDGEEFKTVDYSAGGSSEVFSDLKKFEEYYLKILQVGYEQLQRNMNVVVEFQMPKKYMRVRTSQEPTGCYYYRYDMQKGEEELFVAGKKKDELLKDWRGGIPSVW